MKAGLNEIYFLIIIHMCLLNLILKSRHGTNKPKLVHFAVNEHKIECFHEIIPMRYHRSTHHNETTETM